MGEKNTCFEILLVWEQHVSVHVNVCILFPEFGASFGALSQTRATVFNNVSRTSWFVWLLQHDAASNPIKKRVKVDEARHR